MGARSGRSVACECVVTPLQVGSFGGGVVLFGSPDAQKTDELGIADSYEIGPRGQLVCTSDVSGYYTLKDLQAVPAPWSALHGLGNITAAGIPLIVAIGEAKTAAGTLTYFVAVLERDGAAIPLPGTRLYAFNIVATHPAGHGVYVTIVQFPGTFSDATGSFNAVLVCVGAREGDFPATQEGLVYLLFTLGTTDSGFAFASFFNCLGIGTRAAGTLSGDLRFRGIVSYNNFVFGWGFLAKDVTNGDGPNRVMFSNLGNPMQWGNDNVATIANRAFTDSDAIELGDAGEIIRGALKWNGRLYFGTNSQLHYIAGYGRDSFLTDGANPVAKSYNIVGPYALVEGPDKLMYGVSDQGLWNYDGISFTPLFQKLIDFSGHSIGYWNLMWNDPLLAVGYPGKTNQDLVWTAVDWERFQVLVGIPFCNATLGYGIGNDTVVIKYHPRTGGFTRQVFFGTNYTAASYVRRAGQQRESRIMGTGTAAKVSLQRYGYQVTPTTSPVLPVQLPVVTFGPYDPFGPDGEGVVQRCYLTLAWESPASLPIKFNVTTTGDASIVNSFALTVGSGTPVGPSVGDIWLDTSQTDLSIGNSTAGTNVPATGGYLTKTYSGSAWRFVSGSGENGTRGTIPIPLIRRVATRITVIATCLSAAGRFQCEGLGFDPGGGQATL
jgi:hypothetical protein